MIVTKGLGSEFLITQGYGSGFIVIISSMFYSLSSDVKIGKKFGKLVCTSDNFYLGLNKKLLLGFDGNLLLLLNEKIALELL